MFYTISGKVRTQFFKKLNDWGRLFIALLAVQCFRGRNISPKHVIAYIEYMLSRNYSLPTVYVHLSVIRFYGSKIGYKIPENNILFEKVKEKGKLFTVSKEGVKK